MGTKEKKLISLIHLLVVLSLIFVPLYYFGCSKSDSPVSPGPQITQINTTGQIGGVQGRKDSADGTLNITDQNGNPIQGLDNNNVVATLSWNNKDYILPDSFCQGIVRLVADTMKGDNLEISPLAVGNYWRFIDSSQAITDTSQVNITRTRDINGVTCYDWQWEGYSHFWSVKNHSDGLYCHAYGDTTVYIFPTPELWIKYPASVGDKWVQTSFFEGDTITVTSINANFAGFTGCMEYYNTFDYWKNKKINFFGTKLFNKTKSSYEAYLYFKPGVGYLGFKIFVNGTFSSIKRLIKYNVSGSTPILFYRIGIFWPCQFVYGIPQGTTVEVDIVTTYQNLVDTFKTTYAMP
ncbi:MAG: hypothetical protein FJ216_08630 [Ignavibacteria bacterium]|nr:hypothetical protein [Ignavibacteria bacterium]